MSASDDASDCLFCRIVARDIQATVVHETPNSLAFRDMAPQAPTHVLVVPKRHVPTMTALADASPEELADVIAGDRRRRRASRGSRTATGPSFNTGPDAQQTVFHAHVHVLGGRAMTWPPG